MGGYFVLTQQQTPWASWVTDWWLEMDQENILMPKLGVDDGQNWVTAICWPSAAEMWLQTRLPAGFGPDTEPNPSLSKSGSGPGT